MKDFNKGKILFSLVILMAIVFAVGVVFRNDVSITEAGATDNITGWAWSDTVGWLSFNCASDPVAGCAYDYGVNIDAGDFSGYAWSDNIGWISFEPADLVGCPSGTCTAKLSNNNVTGWARALAADGNGWDGWISLAGDGATWNGSNCVGNNNYRNDNQCNYGVTLNGTNLEGWAWGSAVIGWVQFDPSYGGVFYGVVSPDPPILTFYADLPTITSGESSLLNWATQNIDSCVASGAVGWSGNIDLNGSPATTGTLTNTTTYNLDCSGPGGSVSGSATVTVNAVPPPPPTTVSITANNTKTKVRTIENVPVNIAWTVGGTLSSCAVSTTNNDQGWSNKTDTFIRNNTSYTYTTPPLVIGSGLTKDLYTYSITCDGVSAFVEVEVVPFDWGRI